MASLTKLTITRWIDPRTKARVAANTPGAKKVKEKTDHYYIVDKSSGKVERTNTQCSDHRAAQVLLTQYHRAQERGRTGLTDPFQSHLDRPLLEHLAEYLVVVRDRARTAAYPRTVERELKRMFVACGFVALRDLTAVKIQEYLAGWKVKAKTKNNARGYLYSFCVWLVKGDRLPMNITERVGTAKAKAGEEEKRRRRALKPKELRKLLSAAERYPLVCAGTNRGGRPRKDGTRSTPRPAELTDATLAELQRRGRERRLLYRTAILTGLRRGELSRVKVRHFDTKRRLFDLPGVLTKNGRPAAIPVPSSLVADLRLWIGDTGRGADDALFAVPEASNMVHQHTARLKLAGIAYKTDHGFADFHGIRKTINTFLRRRGVSLRLRQRFLRHAAADLATNTYDDERGSELKPVVELLAKLDAYLTKPEPEPK